MKFAKSILLFSLAINFILGFFSIKLFLDANNLFRRKPELIEKITTNIAEAKIEFDKTVKEEFHIGLPESKLIRELSRQGFTPGWSNKDQSSAVFITSNIACRSVWSITWKVDQHGNIIKIDGKYRPVCL